MAAVQELLIDGLVTASAISGRQLGRDHEAVMVFLFLSGRGLVTVEAVHAFAGVRAHLVFVDDGILRPGVTLGTFPGGAHKVRVGLLGFDLGPCAVQQESSEDQGKGNDDRQKRRRRKDISKSLLNERN